MENRPGRIEHLEAVLDVEGLEDIIGVADGKMGTVGVIRIPTVFVGGDDVRIFLFVVLGKAIGSRFGWSGLEIEEVAVLFLIVAEAVPHMVEDFDGEILSVFVREILFDPASIETGFVHDLRDELGLYD